MDTVEIRFALLPPSEKNTWAISLGTKTDPQKVIHLENRWWLYSPSIMSGRFEYVSTLNYKDQSEQVVKLVERFLDEDGKASRRLRSITKVIVSGFPGCIYKEFYNS